MEVFYSRSIEGGFCTLDPEESVGELARILSGSKITESVLENAREMKQLAEEYKASRG